MVPLLTARNVSVHFGGLKALSNVDFEIFEGEILGLIGPNGAGKSTLFNAITGFVTVEKGGEIFFEGENILGLQPFQICKKGIARTFQLCRTFSQMTALENVRMGALLHFPNVAEATKKAEEILGRFGLLESKDRSVEELTLVDRKKVEVARAIATSPRLMLLDECMTGLTPHEMDEMISVVKGLRDGHGITLCVVEHVMKAIMSVAERIVVLSFGQKIADGPPKEIAVNQDVIDAYFGEEIGIA